MGVREEDAAAKRLFFEWLERHWHEHSNDDAAAEYVEHRQRELGVQRKAPPAAARLYAFKTLRGWLREWRQTAAVPARRNRRSGER